MRLLHSFLTEVGLLACFVSSTIAASINTTLLAPRGGYTLKDTYNAGNFLSSFNFYTGGDPTHGYVNYVNQGTAQQTGLFSTSGNQVYLGVDHTTTNPSSGRSSIRAESNKRYTHGLFITDVAHMPGGICGTWPAFWTVGDNWPNMGEIDIIEGVNAGNTDSMTLHTSAGCVINDGNSQSTTHLSGSDCNAGNANVGCGAGTSNTATYGVGFNNNGGGVYAMQWESSGIYMWFFPRGSIPSDISSGGSPNIGGWGTPLVSFNGNAGCNIDQHFSTHKIIFDTTFCGDWAGSSAVWSSSTCASKASSCQAYVANNPGAFAEAYWKVNYVKVYQL